MSVEKDDPHSSYSVQEQNSRFEVTTPSGRTILVFNDMSSASHYASLLNEAHQAGYKLGFREGKGRLR